MTINFKHPDGVNCQVMCDAPPRIGECITLVVYVDGTVEEKKTYIVKDVEYEWYGTLNTRGGHALFSQREVTVLLGGRVT